MPLRESKRMNFDYNFQFIPKGPTNNIPVLVQIMACWRQGENPLSEPKMVRLPTHICVTRLHWVQGLLIMFHVTLHSSGSFSNEWKLVDLSNSSQWSKGYINLLHLLLSCTGASCYGNVLLVDKTGFFCWISDLYFVYSSLFCHGN